MTHMIKEMYEKRQTTQRKQGITGCEEQKAENTRRKSNSKQQLLSSARLLPIQYASVIA